MRAIHGLILLGCSIGSQFIQSPILGQENRSADSGLLMFVQAQYLLLPTAQPQKSNRDPNINQGHNSQSEERHDLIPGQMRARKKARLGFLSEPG